MKLWLIPTLTLLFFSGCNSTKQNIKLQNKNARQALIIQQQQAKIEALTEEIRYPMHRRSMHRSSALPPEPKKNIKLKKVEDNNFNSDYMYPETKPKKKIPAVPTPVTAPETSSTTTSNISMTKESCISMIGEEKFTKYTKMFGNEAASIKRCAMLKAMKH